MVPTIPYIYSSVGVCSVSLRHLFVYKDGASTAYLLLYVDDIVLTASSTDLLLSIIGRLHAEFAMTDLGDLHHFRGFLSPVLQRVYSCPSDSTSRICYSAPV